MSASQEAEYNTDPINECLLLFCSVPYWVSKMFHIVINPGSAYEIQKYEGDSDSKNDFILRVVLNVPRLYCRAQNNFPVPQPEGSSSHQPI